MKKMLVATLAAFLTASPAMAGGRYAYSGNILADNMQEFHKANRGDANVDYGKAWAFRAYVMGVSDTVSGVIFCPPEQISEGQTLAIVAKYLEDNPAYWSGPASNLVINALSQPFPCKKSR